MSSSYDATTTQSGADAGEIGVTSSSRTAKPEKTLSGVNTRGITGRRSRWGRGDRVGNNAGDDGQNSRTVQVETVPSIRPRRNIKMIIAGLLLICIAGLLGGLIYDTITRQTNVVMMARTVWRGEVITSADLTEVAVGSVPGATVPTAEISSLVGKTAQVDLPERTIVDPSWVGESIARPDSAIVGLKLSAGKLPSSPLPPGTLVKIVQTPSQGQLADVASQFSVDGVVVTRPALLADQQTWVIDVAVPMAYLERVAASAAVDQIAIVKIER